MEGMYVGSCTVGGVDRAGLRQMAKAMPRTVARAGCVFGSLVCVAGLAAE